MSKDYYKTLGLEKTASKDDIKKAFRKLAHEHHPDKKTGNAEKFKEANEAYSVLSDDAKRQQYDTYGSAGPGMGSGGGFGGQGGFGGFDFSGFQQSGNMEFDLGDIFNEFFGQGRQRARRGRDISVDVEVSFHDSIFGTEKTIRVKGKELKVIIPSGINEGEMLRLTGMGEPAQDASGRTGDLYVKIHVKAHPVWTKQGYHLTTELRVKLSDALLGAEYDLVTFDGTLKLKIPEGVTYGEILRVRGRGVPVDKNHRGDLLITVNIIFPRKLSKSAKQAIEALKKEGL